MYVFPLFLGCGGVFLISTVPLQGPSGWAEAGEPTVVKAPLGASESPRFQAKCTLSTPVLKLVQHTPRLLTVTRPRGREISTIVPVSRVGGAKRQSPGRAAGCTAPRRAACPGRRSCSR